MFAVFAYFVFLSPHPQKKRKRKKKNPWCFWGEGEENMVVTDKWRLRQNSKIPRHWQLMASSCILNTEPHTNSITSGAIQRCVKENESFPLEHQEFSIHKHPFLFSRKLLISGLPFYQNTNFRCSNALNPTFNSNNWEYLQSACVLEPWNAVAGWFGSNANLQATVIQQKIQNEVIAYPYVGNQRRALW